MKKVFTIMLAIAMLASIACVSTSARVIFHDTFDTWDPYWHGSMEEPAGKNYPTDVNGNNMLEGFADARVHSARYEDDDDMGAGYKSTYSSLTTGTFWVDVYTELLDNDTAGAGLWWKNTYHEKHEGADKADTYTLKYYPATSKVLFMRDYPESTTDEERIVASYEVPGAPGENMSTMTAVTLGMRVEAGKVSAFVNGTYIASYEDATIGIDACPVILWNDGLHAYWDEYCYGDLNELALPVVDTGNGNDTTNGGGGNGGNGGGNGGGGNNPPVTDIVDVTDDKGNAVTDDSGNKVTQVVTVPSADTNKGPQGNGGAQTGDMAVVVVAMMIIALGSAIVVKKVSSR